MSHPTINYRKFKVNCRETANLINMQFVMKTLVGLRNHVLGERTDLLTG